MAGGAMTPKQLAAIPQALKDLPIWCVWKRTETGAKLPISPVTGKGARSTHREDFTSYENAVAFLTSYYDGLGTGFFPEHGLTGIDLDKCIVDGKIEAWAQHEITILNSYSEVSPSTIGVKIWIVGKLPPGKLCTVAGSRTELYDGSPGRERYFTVTGNHLAGTPTTINTVNPEPTFSRMKAFDP
jgi:putative DNA primase/helicase